MMTNTKRTQWNLWDSLSHNCFFFLNLADPLCIYYGFRVCIFMGFLCVQKNLCIYMCFLCLFFGSFSSACFV